MKLLRSLWTVTLWKGINYDLHIHRYAENSGTDSVSLALVEQTVLENNSKYKTVMKAMENHSIIFPQSYPYEGRSSIDNLLRLVGRMIRTTKKIQDYFSLKVPWPFSVQKAIPTHEKKWGKVDIFSFSIRFISKIKIKS